MINNSGSTSEDVISCDSWSWDGVDYTVSGSYFNTYTSIGCDSTHTVNLTINLSTSQESATAWRTLWNGVTYTESGTYTYESTNDEGCINVATLTVVINNSESTLRMLFRAIVGLGMV